LVAEALGAFAGLAFFTDLADVDFVAMGVKLSFCVGWA
jgi:hypothetical protein